MHINSAASCMPPYVAESSACAVTGPPIRSPAMNDGSGMLGSRSNVSPGNVLPNTTSKTSRMPSTKIPNRTKKPKARPERLLATTNEVAPINNAKTTGFVVRVAAVAMANAHAHHAPG